MLLKTDVVLTKVLTFETLHTREVKSCDYIERLTRLRRQRTVIV